MTASLLVRSGWNGVEKARDSMAPMLGTASTVKLIDMMLAIETVTDVRSLRPLLQRT